MDQQSQAPKKKKYGNPLLYGLAHLLIPALPYLLLHAYKRFYIAIVLVLVALFVPYFGYLVSLGLVVDTYMQLKKMNDGELKPYKADTTQNVIGVVVFILAIFAYLYIQSYIQGLAASPGYLQF